MGKASQKIKHLFYCSLTVVSPRLNSELRFRKTYGRKLDLDNPRRFNEKGMWLKLNRYNNDPLIKKCANKLTVRDYVSEKGCHEILNTLIGVYDSPDDIDFDSLPDSFVIKWNFGCGYNFVCPDKSKIDVSSVRRKLKKWGSKKFHLYFSEMQYKIKNKKLIIETYLKPQTGFLPDDYKVFCFNGQPRYIMVCKDRENGTPQYYFFDTDWNFKRFNIPSRDFPEDFTLPRPSNLGEMLRCAGILSADFPFVRVDFFSCDGKTIFSELTFTPAGYLDNTYYDDADLLLGGELAL